jgi:hypothetical protein
LGSLRWWRRRGLLFGTFLDLGLDDFDTLDVLVCGRVSDKLSTSPSNLKKMDRETQR